MNSGVCEGVQEWIPAENEVQMISSMAVIKIKTEE